MSSYLRQSTASQSRAIGPFLDDTDFKTEETGLTIANTDIKLIVNGGASANKNSGGGTHRANGMYGITFDATDTATVGELEVSVKVAGALAVFKTFFVVEEAVYDAMFAASAPGYVSNAPVNVAQFGGTNGTFSGGRPEVNTTHWGGTAVASAVVPANTIQISGDSVAADNAESFFDGTGYAGTNNVIPTVTTVTTTTNLTNLPAAAALEATLTAMKGATFDGATDSLEALRNRGDSAWTTATGFSTHSAADVWSVGTRALTDKAGFTLSATGSAAMTEGYAALGAAATLPQLLYEVRALLAEKSISSTTLTTKKLDGSTTAATYTLDSATTPSAITRAT